MTGAASGIGLAAAAGFARLGASVWALARDDERAGQAARLIRSRAGAGRPGVRRAAGALRHPGEQVAGVVNVSCGDGPRASPTLILRTAIAYTWSS